MADGKVDISNGSNGFFSRWSFVAKASIGLFCGAAVAVGGILYRAHMIDQEGAINEIKSVVEIVRQQRMINHGDVVDAKFVEKSIGESSLKLTKNFGGDDTVFVSSEDNKFKYIISNYQNTFDSYFDSPLHDGASAKLQFASESFDNSYYVRNASGVTREELNVAMDYNALTSQETTAAAIKTGPGDSKQVAFITARNSEFAHHELNNVNGFPFKVSKGELDSMTLYHEISHVRDTNLLERNYSRSSRLYGIPLSKIEADVISESIADLSSALIAMRETGNKDIYNSIIKPFRLASNKLAGHSTYNLLSHCFEEVEFESVVGKSDIELMTLSQRIVEDKVLVMATEHQKTPSSVFFKELVGIDNEESRYKYLMEQIEASIQNASYMGTLGDSSEKIIQRAEAEAVRIHDEKLIRTIADFKSNGVFDIKQFSETLGLNIDWNAQARRDSNMDIMAKHYSVATGFDIGFQGVETESPLGS